MKTTFKKIAAALLSAAMVFSLAACSNSGNNSSSSEQSSQQSSETSQVEKTDINVAVLKGPTAIGTVSLMDKNDKGEANNNYSFEILGAPEDVVGKITTGEVDIAAVPANLAATLYKKTEGNVMMTNVNTLGTLYILDKSGEVTDINSLKGKTIYATGQGSTPEYVLNYILKQNGIDPEKDVTIEWKTEHSELATLLLSDDSVEIAMLPEPFVTQVTTKSENVKTALDLTEEWDKACGGESGLVMGCLIVRKEFAENNKEALDRFLDEYKESVSYANSDTDACATLVGKYDIMPEEVAKKAIPRCNITYAEGDEMQKLASGFLKVLFDTEPKSVGGQLPDDSFYYKR